MPTKKRSEPSYSNPGTGENAEELLRTRQTSAQQLVAQGPDAFMTQFDTNDPSVGSSWIRCPSPVNSVHPHPIVASLVPTSATLLNSRPQIQLPCDITEPGLSTVLSDTTRAIIADETIYDSAPMTGAFSKRRVPGENRYQALLQTRSNIESQHLQRRDQFIAELLGPHLAPLNDRLEMEVSLIHKELKNGGDFLHLLHHLISTIPASNLERDEYGSMWEMRKSSAHSLAQLRHTVYIIRCYQKMLGTVRSCDTDLHIPLPGSGDTATLDDEKYRAMSQSLRLTRSLHETLSPKIDWLDRELTRQLTHCETRLQRVSSAMTSRSD